MGLLDDLSNEKALINRFSRKCTVCRILEEVTPEEADRLRELLANPAIAKAKIAIVLTKNGYPVKNGVVTRHVRGECVAS